MKCKKHPKYKAIRKPTAKCTPCWIIYAKKHKLLICEIPEILVTCTICEDRLCL